jgi:Ala-tRNA(Pro) deacylase
MVSELAWLNQPSEIRSDRSRRSRSRQGAEGRAFDQAKEILMSLLRLRQFLDSYNTKYVVISHSVAYTAGGIAALIHIPGKEVAKTVIVKVDDRLVMAVVSASQHVDLELFKAATKAQTVRLAAENEFKNRFPDCETGAMPPFGNLYGMSVFADEALSRDQEIAFNAGSHRELVRLTWEDFERLVEPKVIKLAATKHAAEAA